MKNKRILIILRSPFLDRIPSLKTLMWYLLEDCECLIDFVSPTSHKYPLITFSHPRLNIYTVNERSRKLDIPTSAKLYAKCLQLALTKKYNVVLGGDTLGNIIAGKIAKLKKAKHVFFMLEYPSVPAVSKVDKKEHKSIVNSNYVITHDDWHKRFLVDNIPGIDPLKILCVPNASFTEAFTAKSTLLKEAFDLDDEKIILHSGGFGVWFRCGQLAQSTLNWPNNYRLVFHTSHSMVGNAEFEKVKSLRSDKILLSDKPVDTLKLDSLVASADIGLALYDENVLGYRATYMGLAAGKIGNYLKCGVPVIATRLPSLSYLEEYGCGILIDDETEIADAISKILSDRQSYSENAYRCYNDLWHPSNYLKAISDRILSDN